MLKRLCLVLLVGCTDVELAEWEGQVIGGAPSSDGKFPGVGALMYEFGDGPQPGCTGTLIAPDAVLTAAHCVDPDLVGAGVPGFTFALDATAPGVVVVPGRAAFKHPQFQLVNPGAGLGEFFDVGIVLLAEPVTDVAPVRMPRPADVVEIVEGLDLEIAGYGRIDNNSDEFGILFDARTKLISLNATEIQVGNGSPQPQNCNGDSGGPGFATVGGTRRVVGIVSRSFNGPECTMGGIDTRVDAYLAFIHEKVPLGIPCDSGMAEACPIPPDEADEDGGCCSISGGARGLPGSASLALAVMLLLRRRRVR